MILNNNKLLTIEGGASISGTLLNSIAKLINTIFDVGRAIGTAISMSTSGKKC